MPTTLRNQLQAFAHTFVDQVLGTIQGASLHEIAGTKGSGRVIGGGRSARTVAAKTVAAAPKMASVKASGRLARRTDEEIQAMLGKVVLLVKTHKEGMRAEQIRSTLGMLPKEMPLILKQGVSTKKLMTKGQKRATTYFAK